MALVRVIVVVGFAAAVVVVVVVMAAVVVVSWVGAGLSLVVVSPLAFALSADFVAGFDPFSAGLPLPAISSGVADWEKPESVTEQVP